MSQIEAKLQAMGLVLPEPLKVPAGLNMPFSWVRVRGNRAYISGHIPQNPDGTIAEPFGRVGAEVTVEQGYHAARLDGQCGPRLQPDAVSYQWLLRPDS